MLDRSTGFRIKGIAILLATTLPCVAVASSNDLSLPPVPFGQSALEYSPVLRGGVGYKEEYIARVLAQFRAHAGEDQILDRQDSEKRASVQAAMQRATVVSQFISLDLDQDGKVSLAEVETVDSLNRGGRASSFSRMDADRDGMITLSEWETSSASTRTMPSGHSTNIVDAYLALDLNHDGTLTADELRSVATSVFDQFDTDGDGSISREEAQVWASGRSNPIRKQERILKLEPSTQLSIQPEKVVRRTPPIPMVVAAPPSVSIQTINGASADAGFSVRGKAGVKQGADRKFVVKATGGTGKLSKQFWFEIGRNFKVTSSECGSLETNGSCEITAAMTASYNGIFKDKLQAKIGGVSASIEVTGQAVGWPDPDLIWEGQNSPRMSSGQVPDGNLLRVTDSHSEYRTFNITNAGAGYAPPPELSVTDVTGDKKDGWKVTIDDRCASDGIAPGGSCSVVVHAQPKWDGQGNGLIMLSAHGRGVPAKTLVLGSIAKGVAGKLPEGVIGNGDACPAPGSAAEVAVSSTDGFRSNDGYFSNKPYGGGSIERSEYYSVATAGCESWERDEHDGKMSCKVENSGGHHSSTLRRYEAKSIEGPWTPTELRPGYISARLDCRDGVIETIDWTW